MTNIDWLKSFHSFSFGEYFNPDNINFGPLRVLNDDTILAGGGFPKHPHRDMEIVTIVTEGAVAHEDSMGHKEVIRAGEIQRMTAGAGVFHSEFNNSDYEDLKLLQIWLMPNRKGLEPSYQQIQYDPAQSRNKLLKLVSGKESGGQIFINQDADIYRSNLEEGKVLEFQIKPGRGVYIFVIEGIIEVNGKGLFRGDAAEISEENSVSIKAADHSDFIFFDLNLEGY